LNDTTQLLLIELKLDWLDSQRVLKLDWLGSQSIEKHIVGDLGNVVSKLGVDAS